MSKGLKFFFIAFLASFFGIFALNIFQENLENSFYAQISQSFQQISKVKIPEKPKLDLKVKSVISVKTNEAGRQKVLFEKNTDQILPIASLTKLMTAVIVLEHQENYGPSQEDLLNRMLIQSDNKAAQALAEVIGETKFVDLMNEKAKNLGLEKTNFVNPTGLDPEDPENLEYGSATQDNFNRSTAKDLVKLTQYILKEQPLIFEISSQGSIKNGIFDLFLIQEIIGGKTGYTDEAGGCILFVFKNEGGNFLINVILGAPSPSARIEEMQKLIDWLNK